MLSPKCWRGRKITNSVGFLGAIPMGQMRWPFSMSFFG